MKLADKSIYKVFLTVCVESVLGIAFLFFLPNKANSPFNISGERLFLIIVLLLLFFLSLGFLLKLKSPKHGPNDPYRFLKRVSTSRHQTSVFTVFLTLGLISAMALVMVWLFLSQSYHPLLLRLGTLFLPIATFSGLGLRMLLGQLSAQKKSMLARDLAKILLIGLAIVEISGMTVYFQVRWQGMEWVRTSAVEDHQFVMDGVAGNPWQFRVLPEYLVEITRYGFELLGLRDALVTSLILWRVLENILFLSATLFYYKRLGLKTYAAVLAIGVIGLTLPDAINGSNLALNTYLDVLFYVLAGYVILKLNYLWILPITFLAALNRETSGLIPFMLLGDYFYNRQKYRHRQPNAIAVFAVSSLGYLIVFFGLRFLYPTEGLLIPNGVQPGQELLQYNLSKSGTWIQLFTTFGIIPFLALYAFRKFPRTLQVFAILVVPVWFVIHFFLGVIAETRLLLVPYVLVLIPGVFLSATET